MNENQMRVIKMIEEQQKALDEYTPTRMVGEQLKDICRAEPESAELLEQDLQKKGMGLADAEKMIRARADEIHKNMKGTGVVVPPWEAEDILRKFYGLPERTWGPGKEKADSSAARDGEPVSCEAQNDGTGDADRIQELTEQLARANSRAIDAETTRDQILRETEESRQKAETAEQKAKAASEELIKAKAELAEARKAAADAMKKLNAAKADKSVPKETLEKLRKEAEEAAEASHKADYEKLDQAQKNAARAEAEAARARQEAEEASGRLAALQAEKEKADKQCLSLQAELRLAAPELAVFRAGFERVQTELMDLIHSVDKLPEEKKVGARRGLAAMLQQMHERIGGGENA